MNEVMHVDKERFEKVLDGLEDCISLAMEVRKKQPPAAAVLQKAIAAVFNEGYPKLDGKQRSRIDKLLAAGWVWQITFSGSNTSDAFAFKLHYYLVHPATLKREEGAVMTIKYGENKGAIPPS